jgi:hypothetical protein
MKPSIALIALLIPLSVRVDVGTMERKPLVVHLSTGQQLEGELLSVRDSALLMFPKFGVNELTLINSVRAVRVIPFCDVRSIVVLGEDGHPITGALVGGAVGCAAGCVIGSTKTVKQKPEDTFGCQAEQEKQANTSNGGFLGGIFGSAIGLAVGVSMGGGDVILIDSTRRDFLPLRYLARYPNGEPEYILKAGE